MDAEVIMRISHNIFVFFTLDSSDDWDSTFDGERKSKMAGRSQSFMARGGIE